MAVTAPRPRRGRPPQNAHEPGVRERVLAAAIDLFYAQGVAPTSVDEVAERAGVSKMSLYAHYGSKDALAAAALAALDGAWSRWVRDRVEAEPGLPARERLLRVFDAVAEWSAQPEFCGCPFINAAAEARDLTSPAARAALASKDRLRADLTALAREAGAPDPPALARRLLLLIDGALVGAMLRPGPEPAHDARAVAESLLHPP